MFNTKRTQMSQIKQVERERSHYRHNLTPVKKDTRYSCCLTCLEWSSTRIISLKYFSVKARVTPSSTQCPTRWVLIISRVCTLHTVDIYTHTSTSFNYIYYCYWCLLSWLYCISCGLRHRLSNVVVKLQIGCNLVKICVKSVFVTMHFRSSSSPYPHISNVYSLYIELMCFFLSCIAIFVVSKCPSFFHGSTLRAGGGILCHLWPCFWRFWHQEVFLRRVFLLTRTKTDRNEGLYENRGVFRAILGPGARP